MAVSGFDVYMRKSSVPFVVLEVKTKAPAWKL